MLICILAIVQESWASRCCCTKPSNPNSPIRTPDMKKNFVASAGWTVKVWRGGGGGTPDHGSSRHQPTMNDVLIATSSTAPLYEDLNPYCEIAPAAVTSTFGGAKSTETTDTYQYRAFGSKKKSTVGRMPGAFEANMCVGIICDRMSGDCEPHYCHLPAGTVNRKADKASVIAGAGATGVDRGSVDMGVLGLSRTNPIFSHNNRAPSLRYGGPL